MITMQARVTRGHLALLLPVRPREVYANDRTDLIRATQALTGRRFARPLDALRAVFSTLGWRLGKRALEPDRWACTDPWTRTVWLCSDLAEKLRSPEALPAVAAFSLAHELAHIRLHLPEICAGRLSPEHEQEADHYAGVFLVPARLLRTRPEFEAMQGWIHQPTRPTSEQLWRATGSLANWFGVSRQAMAHQLAELGLVRFCPRTMSLEVAA